MFSEAIGVVGIAILLHLLIPKRWIAKTPILRCGLCLSGWLAIGLSFYEGRGVLALLQLVGHTTVLSVLVLTWAPWVWSTTEAPTLPEQP